MTTVNTLLYKHFVCHEDTLEGNIDPDKAKSAYNMWANFCVITAITQKCIKIELPDKAKPREYPISYYSDYKILNRLWVVCADYGKDIDEYYWCRNWIQATGGDFQVV